MDDSTYLESFVGDVASIRKLPGWVAPFREKYYSTAGLPILLIYHAAGIAQSEGSGLYRDKSGSIAVATKALQNKKLLGEGTNKLTYTGEIKELATMKNVGKLKLESYIEYFRSL